MAASKGVDLSELNGAVDFAALQAAGVRFVLLRTGYGSDYPGQQDKRFAENVEKAEAAGMPWGAYHYSYARTAAAGKAEAAHALRVLDGRKPPMGLWLDMEDKSTVGGNLAAAAEAFCMAMETAAVYVGIYASASWWKHNLTSPVFDRWDKWVAQYNSMLEYGTAGENVGLWQFTDRWTIGGKAFDGNYCYRDYPRLTGTQQAAPARESRVFSRQRNGITKAYGNGHSGVDLGWVSDPNTPVTAHSAGMVSWVQTGVGSVSRPGGDLSYGNCVKLLHPNGYSTLYAHLSRVEAKPGQEVGQGEEIGRMGNTGYSGGCHLHFEVRDRSGACIDPTPYINADLPGLPTEKEDDEMLSYEQFKAYMQQYEQEKAAAPVAEWAQPAVDFVKKHGYMVGDPDGGFRGESTVTRQELAQVIKNIEGA